MAEAGDGEEEEAFLIGERKGGGAQGEERAQLLARNGHASQLLIRHPAAGVLLKGPDPGFLRAGEIRLGVSGEDHVPKVQGRTAQLTHKARNILGGLGTGDAHQIGKGVPDLPALFGAPRGGGVKHRQHRLPFIGKGLAGGGLHGGADARELFVRVFAPASPERSLAAPGLAAAGIGAEVRLRMLVGADLPKSIAPGGHCLGLQGLLGEGGGHLRRHNPHQVVLQGELQQLVSAQKMNALRLGRIRRLLRGGGNRRGEGQRMERWQGRGSLFRPGSALPRQDQRQQIQEQQRAADHQQVLFQVRTSISFCRT